MTPFFIVWSPTGSAPPSVRHAVYEHALAEAERLAATASRAEFFVLMAVSRSQRKEVMTEAIAGAAEILRVTEMPF